MRILGVSGLDINQHYSSSPPWKQIHTEAKK